MSPADVKLSKGQTPKIDRARAIVSPVTGAVVGVWQGTIVIAKPR